MAKAHFHRGRSQPIRTRLRHLKLARALIEGKTHAEAVLFAGYPENTAKVNSSKIIRSAMPVIQEIMDEAGLTVPHLAHKLKSQTEAMQYKPMQNKEGVVTTWEAPDHRVQQQALELATEIQGMRRWGLPGEGVSQSNVQVNVSFGGNTQSLPSDGKPGLPVNVSVTSPKEEDEPIDVEFTEG